MGRDAAKACENQCFRCRKEAAKYNDKLGSREGAAELLGISVSSLADYELGNTKVIPVDKVVLMADIYNAPELMAWYCSSESANTPSARRKCAGIGRFTASTSQTNRRISSRLLMRNRLTSRRCSATRKQAFPN